METGGFTQDKQLMEPKEPAGCSLGKVLQMAAPGDSKADESPAEGQRALGSSSAEIKRGPQPVGQGAPRAGRVSRTLNSNSGATQC